jgi:hypothetical protein
MDQKIELRQVRGFSELVNDTFGFAKQNLKPLLYSILLICGFFFIAHIISATFYAIIINDAIVEGDIKDPSRIFSWEYLANTLFTMLFYSSIALTVFCYIKLYLEKGNQVPEVQEVWTEFKLYFWRFFGCNILLGILVVIGFVFCLLPGLYLLPITSLISAVLVFENASFSYAFDRGFKLIKNNWWITFGALFIIFIVVGAVAMIVILPITFIATGSLLFTKVSMSVPLVILRTVLSSFAQVFMLLPYVLISLCYFSLVEGKDGEGLMDRVNNIGNNGPDSNLPEEQY